MRLWPGSWNDPGLPEALGCESCCHIDIVRGIIYSSGFGSRDVTYRLLKPVMVGPIHLSRVSVSALKHYEQMSTSRERRSGSQSSGMGCVAHRRGPTSSTRKNPPCSAAPRRRSRSACSRPWQAHAAQLPLDQRHDMTAARPEIRSPFQYPDTARSLIAAGRSLIGTASLIWPSPSRFRLA